MKNIGIIFLLASLILPFGGSYLWLHYQKKIIKREVKHQMIEVTEKTELVKLTFAKHELKEIVRWEHSKEFEYRGQMYDVIEKSELTDSVTYWCWWDNEETKLNKSLEKLFQQAWEIDPRNNSNQHRVLVLLKTLFIENTKMELPLIVQTKMQPLVGYQTCCSDINQAPSTPPPRFIC